ncbi:YopX family protein [Alkaliphilus sp. B6464]|uniref:YopX family protein n=1 Tax=Alkaliphilus sp. B6464 TaxID=2731219 RepID=UPI001BA7D064|nr:YopX family protein [Alkaliphilus sp. B6464]QUH22225.1 hypothetical protein HYG84_20165 [Alkaliphilus sp. B6464]
MDSKEYRVWHKEKRQMFWISSINIPNKSVELYKEYEGIKIKATFDDVIFMRYIGIDVDDISGSTKVYEKDYVSASDSDGNRIYGEIVKYRNFFGVKHYSKSLNRYIIENTEFIYEIIGNTLQNPEIIETT